MFRQQLAIPKLMDKDSGYMFRLELPNPLIIDSDGGYMFWPVLVIP